VVSHLKLVKKRDSKKILFLKKEEFVRVLLLELNIQHGELLNKNNDRFDR